MLLDYARSHRIPVPTDKEKAPYSMDANLLHISYEGKALEDPWVEAGEIDVPSVRVAGGGAE